MFQETAGVQVYENPASCNSFYKCENGTATAEVFALRATKSSTKSRSWSWLRIAQECENGLLFDPMLAMTDAVHNYCVYMWPLLSSSTLSLSSKLFSKNHRYDHFPHIDYNGCVAWLLCSLTCKLSSSKLPSYCYHKNDQARIITMLTILMIIIITMLTILIIIIKMIKQESRCSLSS